MPFEKFTGFTFSHAAQDDTPDLTPAEVKAAFDSRGGDLKTYLDALIDALNSTTSGSSGADKLGMTKIAGLTGETAQTIVGALKAYVDATSLDGVSNPGANIDLVGGSGITITPNDTAKTITITATGDAQPASHASSHGSNGTDPITPAAIGAATATALSDLAGTGRTTETVKGNAGAIATHLADTVQQQFLNVRGCRYNG